MLSKLIFKKRDAYHVYLYYAAAEALLFAIYASVSMIYQITFVGLLPLQLVLVGTVLEASVLLFEIPTGVVADVYSRRLSVIIGIVLTGIGFGLMVVIPTFAGVLLGNAVWGFGYTFVSGALDAWLVDEIGQTRAENAFLRGSQLQQITGFVGLLVGIGLGSYVLITLPIFVSSAGYILFALTLLVMMPEVGFKQKPREERNTWRDMSETLGKGVNVVRSSPVLISVMLISIIWGTSTEGFDRLWQAYMIKHFAFPALPLGGDPIIIWMGILGVASRWFSVTLTEIARRRMKDANNTTLMGMLFGFSSLRIVSLMVFGLAGNFWIAIFTYPFVTSSLGAFSPLFRGWMNRSITDSDVRATVISMTGQSDAMGQVLGGPGVGVLGNRSLRAAMLISGLLVIPTLPFYAWLTRRNSEETVQALTEQV